jgi:hypothetical protein
MTKPNGALVVWHDVPPGFEGELDAWYQREHLPERLAVPGFRSARRYRGTGGGPGFLALYETDDVGILASPAYLARLADPTPATQAVMPNFRNMVRCACTLEQDEGRGIGGTLAVLASATRPEPPRIDSPQVQRVRLLRTERAATQVRNPEAARRPQPDALVDWILLVEAIGEAPLERALAGFEKPHIFRLMCAF